MRIAKFASEAEKMAWQKAKEIELSGTMGGRWRVDVADGRYGCYVRAIRLCDTPGCIRPQKRCSNYCYKCAPGSHAPGSAPADA